jgi:hypothetical protein
VSPHGHAQTVDRARAVEIARASISILNSVHTFMN